MTTEVSIRMPSVDLSQHIKRGDILVLKVDGDTEILRAVTFDYLGVKLMSLDVANRYSDIKFSLDRSTLADVIEKLSDDVEDRKVKLVQYIPAGSYRLVIEGIKHDGD